MTKEETEIWNGHTWALWALASKIGPMTDQYDGYSAEADLHTLAEILKHAQWLKEHIEALPRLTDDLPG